MALDSVTDLDIAAIPGIPKRRGAVAIGNLLYMQGDMILVGGERVRWLLLHRGP